MLLAATIINTQDVYRDTLLSIKARNSHSVIVQLLLEVGAWSIGPELSLCCSFLEATERLEGYTTDALLRVRGKGLADDVCVMLGSAAE